jgi:hypothetical protein
MSTNPETDATMHADLREKIKSKMDVAKFFAAFFTLFVAMSSDKLAAAVANGERSQQIAGWVAVLAGLTSLALTFSAVSAFDSLLMPESLWARKNSYSTQHLAKEMMRAWTHLYRPAVFFLFVAILALFYIVSCSSALLFCGIAVLVFVAAWERYVTKHQGVF